MQCIYQSNDRLATSLEDHENGYYLIQLIGKVRTEDYRRAFQAVLNHTFEDPYHKIILNIRDLKGNPDFAFHWLSRTFIPKFAKQSGGLQLAIIKPQKKAIINTLPMMLGLTKTLGTKMEINFVDHLKEAQYWIETDFGFGENLDLDLNFGGYGGGDDDDFNFSDNDFQYGSKPKKKKGWGLPKFNVKFDPKGALKDDEDEKPNFFSTLFKTKKD